MSTMRRLIVRRNRVSVYHPYKCCFSTKRKSKIKIEEEEYDEFGEEKIEHIEEATVEKETKTKTKTSFKQNAFPTISNIQFSDDGEDDAPCTIFVPSSERQFLCMRFIILRIMRMSIL